MAETLTLTYLNEDDKAYGLAGMAISLAALDAMDFVADISLDADGPMVNFSQQYYHPASPATSVKSNWDNLLHNFYITSAMVISNVMARSLVRMHSPVPKKGKTPVRWKTMRLRISIRAPQAICAASSTIRA